MGAMRNGELLVFLGAFATVGFVGCKQESGATRSTAASSIPSPPMSAPAPTIVVPQPRDTSAREAPAPLAVGITWQDPSAWTRLNRPSPMRAATYKIPQPETADAAAEVAVFYFGAGQ